MAVPCLQQNDLIQDRPLSALIPNLCPRFPDHTIPRLSLGESTRSKKAGQADNAPVSKKQAQNPRQTENASRQEIPITFAKSLCARAGLRKQEHCEISYYQP